MIERLVKIYQEGGITAHHLVLECLHVIDPEHPELVLAPLPREVWVSMLAFIEDYQQGPLLTTHRIHPAMDQVTAAKRWIESRSSENSAVNRETAPPMPEERVGLMTDEQRRFLWNLYQEELAAGSPARDRLPYTKHLETIRSRFNSQFDVAIGLEEIWNALSDLDKNPRRRKLVGITD